MTNEHNHAYGYKMSDEAESNGNGESTENGKPKTSRRSFLAASATTGALAVTGIPTTAAAGASNGNGTHFVVRIENVSTPETLKTSASGDAAEQPVPLSPGAYAVHTEPEPIFTAGEPARGNGLEEIAEDGKPKKLAESLGGNKSVKQSGAFTTPVDADEAGPLTPGNAYEFEVEASPGDRLSFATMFIPSNDLFYSPNDRGHALFDGEDPLSGDITLGVALWNAGTEVNEEPGVGPDQVQRQPEPDHGETEDGVVQLISEVGDGYEYPATSEVIAVTLEQQMN